MKKYTTVVNDQTKECAVGIGTDIAFYQSIGMTLMDVEQAYNGKWYLTGYSPIDAPKSYAEKRAAEYPTIPDQLDMIYWDKINSTNIWQNKIAEIKTKYPKK